METKQTKEKEIFKNNSNKYVNKILYKNISNNNDLMTLHIYLKEKIC